MNLDNDKFRGFMKSAEDSSGKPGDGEQLVNWQLLECFLLLVVFYRRKITTKSIHVHRHNIQVRMNNERFMVPEILFRPSDIGIQQVMNHQAFHPISDKREGFPGIIQVMLCI